MNRTSPALGSLIAFFSLVSSAMAAAPAGVTATIDGKTIVATGKAASPIALRQLPDDTIGTTQIYNNFNSDPANSYDCCAGWTIFGSSSNFGFQIVAMPFKPSRDYNISTIEVAASYVSGTNGVVVTLNKDEGGLPGAVIRQGSVSGLPSAGTCCTTVSISTKGAAVAAGDQYWVVVAAGKKASDTWSQWNFNNVGAEGIFAFNNGTGWQLSVGTLGAFSVYGK